MSRREKKRDLSEAFILDICADTIHFSGGVRPFDHRRRPIVIDSGGEAFCSAGLTLRKIFSCDDEKSN